MTPYGGGDLGQHWFRYWLVAWQHQAITWNNVELSSLRSSDVHLRAISLEPLRHILGFIRDVWSIYIPGYWIIPPFNHGRSCHTHYSSWAHFCKHGLTLIPVWISNNIHDKVCYEITYTFSWINCFLPYFTGHVVTYPCWDWSQSV